MRTDPHSGLVTLEWLLIFAAIAGLAASSVLTVQRVLDDTSDVPADPAVRVIDADIAAAFIASEADAAALAGTTDFTDFSQRCTHLGTAFDVVVQWAVWTPPVTIPPSLPDQPEPTVDTHAECKVSLRSNLGG